MTTTHIDAAFEEFLHSKTSGPFGLERRDAFRSGYLAAIKAAAEACMSVAAVETERRIGVPTTGEYEIGARNCARAVEALGEASRG